MNKSLYGFFTLWIVLSKPTDGCGCWHGTPLFKFCTSEFVPIGIDVLYELLPNSLRNFYDFDGGIWKGSERSVEKNRLRVSELKCVSSQ
jgi:hypothetical protein